MLLGVVLTTSFQKGVFKGYKVLGSFDRWIEFSLIKLFDVLPSGLRGYGTCGTEVLMRIYELGGWFLGSSVIGTAHLSLINISNKFKRHFRRICTSTSRCWFNQQKRWPWRVRSHPYKVLAIMLQTVSSFERRRQPGLYRSQTNFGEEVVLQ